MKAQPIRRLLVQALRGLACRVGIHSTIWHRDRYDGVAVRVCWRCQREIERKLLPHVASLALLGCALAGCAIRPETSVQVAYDPATGRVDAAFVRGWQSGPVFVRGRYSAPDGTAVDFVWCSDVDVGDAADARQAQLDRIEQLAVKVLETAGAAVNPIP